MDIKTDKERLIRAFDHMVENVSQALHEAEEALAPTIDELVHNAQTLASEIHKLSQEESEKLGEALKRDIQKANKTLNQQKKELKDWLSFDLTLVEDKFIELVSRAADKSWLDFRDFENENKAAETYRTGEICSAGTLCCKSCAQTMNLSKTTHIPPCPKCHHTEFYRVIS
jgi:outer membrane murein-binding lipoprotein Lpp